jgi:hypothetical protein
MNRPIVLLPPNTFDDFQVVQNASADPLERLKASDAVRRLLRSHEGTLVDLARREGKTWDEIGEAIGVSGQAAHQRYSS